MGSTGKANGHRVSRTGTAGRAANGNRKVKPARRKRTGLWIGIMAIFFIEALFYAWCRVQCVNTGYDIDRETQRNQALVAQRNTLKIELARLKSPERIETIARKRLGLTMPESRQTVRLP